MEAITPLLTVSILFNLFLLRWALKEYRARLELEREAGALEKALRHISHHAPEAQERGGSAFAWGLAMLILLALAFSVFHG